MIEIKSFKRAQQRSGIYDIFVFFYYQFIDIITVGKKTWNNS